MGTGKTTLINALLKSLDDSVIVATIPDPGLDELDLFNYIADLYGIDRTFTSKGEFLIHFKRFLNGAHDDGKKILLIIDEAQQLNQERLEVIRLLSNIERQETKLINIFFVGQNEFNDTLLQPENRALRQRITINYNIIPLTASETAEYIAHRLKVAGAARQIFHPDAVKRVAASTGGYPRLINVLCDYALVTGYVRGAQVILPAIIDECARELQIPQGSPAPRQPPVEAATTPLPRILAGAGVVAPAADFSPSQTAPLPRDRSQPPVGSAASAAKPPVKVVMRQAHLPSKKPRRKTGLYLIAGMALVLGALLYLLPGGILPLSGSKEGPSERVEKPPAAAVSPEVSVPGAPGVSKLEKEVAVPAARKPAVSVPEQEPVDTLDSDATKASSPGSPVMGGNTAETEGSDSSLPLQPEGSLPASTEKPVGDGQKQPIADNETATDSPRNGRRFLTG